MAPNDKHSPSLNEKQFRRVLPPPFADKYFSSLLSETAELLYVTTDYYMPLNERSLAWDDGELAFVLPICRVPAVSSKDSVGRLHGDLRGNQ